MASSSLFPGLILYVIAVIFEIHFNLENRGGKASAPISILIDIAEHKHNSSIAAQKQEASDSYTLIHSQKWEAAG